MRGCLKGKYWKVGELSKQTGLTVRMLHHYDKIGLFSPSQYSDSGHRLYTESDISVLQQIMSLKQLGFSLEEIKEIRENKDFNPIELVQLQINDVKKRIQLQKMLCSRLERVYEMLIKQQEVTPEQFINLIEVMNMNIENYFTKEQLTEMAKGMGELTDLEKRKQYGEEWFKLIEKIRVEMKKGTPPENVDVVRLNELDKMLTGVGTLQISESIEQYYKDYPGVAEKFGMDKELYEYIKEALSHINK
jgi:DNA-binding transcriptional MerR regulator